MRPRAWCFILVSACASARTASTPQEGARGTPEKAGVWQDVAAPSTEAEADGWICRLIWETRTIVRTSCLGQFSAELLAAYGEGKPGDLLHDAMASTLDSQVRAEHLLVLTAAQQAGRTHFLPLGDASPAPDFANRKLVVGGLFELLAESELTGRAYPKGKEPLPVVRALEIMNRDGETKGIQIR